MKYSQDQNASGEILRLIIQKMAGHPAAFTPLNYAVWYEYVTGINLALSEAMTDSLDRGDKLDDAAIEKLYVNHVLECNSALDRVLRQDIQQLFGNLAGATEETDKQIHQFGNNLQEYGVKLTQTLDVPKLTALTNDMVGDTGKMQDSMQSLKSELLSSRQQVERLHQDLQAARGEALIDPLTGIPNRRGFEAKAKKILAELAAPDKGACMLMLDIDYFKKINDTYGHLFGDKVICGIAKTLKSKVRGQDSVARLGGEEFGILLSETDTSGALVVAEQIRQSIERSKIQRANSREPIGGITISIGVAAHAKGDSLEDLLDRADKALYTSKGQGRNRTTLYNGQEFSKPSGTNLHSELV